MNNFKIGLQKPFCSISCQWAMVVLLAVLCAVLLAKFVLMLVADSAYPAVTFPSSGARPLAKLQLYPAKGAASANKTLSEASVDAQLLGVIHGSHKAFANMRVKGKKDAVFAVGDSLISGVTIKTIEPQRVTVNERGVLRAITLKSLLAGKANSQVKKVARSAPTLTQSTVKKPVLMPAKVMVAITTRGETGLQLTDLSSDLQNLGLVKDGDVLTGVDGRPLSQLMANPQVLQKLMKRPRLSISLERHGEEITVDVDSDVVNSFMGQ